MYTPTTINETNYTTSSDVSTNYQVMDFILLNDSVVTLASTDYNLIGEDLSDPTIYNTVNYTEA